MLVNMKKLIPLACVLLPMTAMAYCPMPESTGDLYGDRQEQRAYQNCLNNQRYQRQQLELQQEQVQIQQQQLQLQRQQMNDQRQYQPDYNIIKPIRPAPTY